MAEIIHTSNAPEPIGPYSQAILVQNTLYCSGQIAIDPSTGDLVQESLTAETHQVLRNLQAVLKAADMDFHQVVKCSIFLSSMSHFQEVNEVYAHYFSHSQPARETVAVAGLPKGVNVEISCIAVR